MEAINGTIRDDGGDTRRKRNRLKPPPGLAEEERRERWERQRRKWIWEEGDIHITRRGDGKKRKGTTGTRARGSSSLPGH